MESHANDLTGIALVTTVAVVCGLFLRRLGQPSIVGYILAGVLLGPTALGLVHNSGGVEMLAELGVIMLLFLIGMELSVRAFAQVLVPSLLCAAVQIAAALGVTFGLRYLFGWSFELAVLLGFLMSLSSTAVAIRMLDDIGELRSQTGRITVGVLIAQDLAVVPMLIVARGMGGGGDLGIELGFKLALAVGILAGATWFLGRRHRIRLPTAWMRGEADLIPLSALAFCFTAATVSGLLGLSAAYGAFLAGLIVGNSTDRAATIRATQPIQSVLLVVFFLSIGLLIDLNYIWANLWEVILLVLAVALIKTVINVAALHALGEPWERAFTAGVVMGQIGEFSFVIAGTGLSVAAIDAEDYRLAIAVIAFSLLISPLWMISARRFHLIAAHGVKSIRTALGEVYSPELSMVKRAAVVTRTVAVQTATGVAAGAVAAKDLAVETARRRKAKPAEPDPAASVPEPAGTDGAAADSIEAPPPPDAPPETKV